MKKLNKSFRRFTNLLHTNESTLSLILIFLLIILFLYLFTSLKIPLLRPSKTNLFPNVTLASLFNISALYRNEPKPSGPVTFNFRERACIIYLIKHSEEDNFRKSVESVYKHFNRRFRYPVIAFYDQYYPLKDMVNLIQDMRRYDPPVKFEYVEFKNPAHYDREKDPPKVWASHTLGYQLMIRFWFRDLFMMPVMQRYRYYMRFDTDSFLHSVIDFDPFVEMKEKNLTYGYRTITRDEAYVTVGMYDFVETYLKTHTTFAKKNKLEVPAADKRNKGTPMMYNNFEMVDIKRFKQKDMVEFVEAVDKTNMIMTHRWGDAPLRYFEIMMCLDWSIEVWNFCNFTYEHAHHNYVAKKCKENHIG